LKYLQGVVGTWLFLLILSILLAAFTNWNEIVIGLTIGIIAGFLPSFALAIMGNLREWNIENIEKLYAPLMSEIDDLKLYFSGDKELSGASLFVYGESREHLLSTKNWEKIDGENLKYRLSLDDDNLAKKLSNFYFVLCFYLKNRKDFMESTLDPVLNKFFSKKNPMSEVDDLLLRLKITIKNFVLDSFDPIKGKIPLGFYTKYTNLNSDFDQAKIYTNISVETFEDLLLEIGKEIGKDVNGSRYTMLLEQRKQLLEDSFEIKFLLKQKLEKARPI
jgi:hypothetical protein